MENENRIPVHVSIIMDGNGRWAREQGHERIFGHKKGVETVRVVAEAAAEEQSEVIVDDVPDDDDETDDGTDEDTEE